MNAVAKITGRPSLLSDEMARMICERIEVGESLVDICRDDDMPGYTTVRRWLRNDENFRRLYADAREAQADYMFHKIGRIAEDVGNHIVRTPRQPRDEHGQYAEGEVREVVVFDAAAIAAARLQIDVLKWQAAKLKPKVYGERIDVEQKVEASGNITFTTIYESKPDQKLIDVTPTKGEEDDDV